jgi:hypothetical protein
VLAENEKERENTEKNKGTYNATEIPPIAARKSFGLVVCVVVFLVLDM